MGRTLIADYLAAYEAATGRTATLIEKGGRYHLTTEHGAFHYSADEIAGLTRGLNRLAKGR